MNNEFSECYRLWRKCLNIERKAIRELIKEGKLYEVAHLPFYNNGEILINVKNKAGNEEFLDSFEFLLDYPEKVNIGNISSAIESLESLPSEYNEKIEKIFDKLIDRNPTYYDKKETWKKKIKN
jgi:hypothetical protein